MSSFCVEHGRWHQRGAESDAHFESSFNALPTRELRRAATYERSQGRVWDSVAAVQEDLERRLGSSVRAAASQSSLQLSLENGQVRQTTDALVQALLGVVAEHPDAIGCVCAIGGKPVSLDVYATRRLFRKLWPRLLRTSATETLARPPSARTKAKVTPAKVRTATAAWLKTLLATGYASGKLAWERTDQHGEVCFRVGESPAGLESEAVHATTQHRVHYNCNR